MTTNIESPTAAERAADILRRCWWDEHRDAGERPEFKGLDVEIEEACTAHAAAAEAEAARLKEENERHKRWHRRPTHGPCCTCQRCGMDYDSCRCDFEETCNELAASKAEVARLKAPYDDAVGSYARVCHERDRLRAELAAAKQRIAELEKQSCP